jgi:hypothetical protein
MLRADLDHVGVCGDQRDVVGLQRLGHDRQPGQVARLGQDAQARLAEALEGVGRGARFECAAAQHLAACRLDRQRRHQRLVAALDRAWPGDRHWLPRAERDAADLHDRTLLWIAPRREAVWSAGGDPGFAGLRGRAHGSCSLLYCPPGARPVVRPARGIPDKQKRRGLNPSASADLLTLDALTSSYSPQHRASRPTRSAG